MPTLIYFLPFLIISFVVLITLALKEFRKKLEQQKITSEETITPVRVTTSAGVEWRCPKCDNALHPMDRKCPGCKTEIA